MVARTWGLLLAIALVVWAAPGQTFVAGAQNATDREQLRTYARVTWASLDAMKPDAAALIADNMSADGTLAGHTSPTNVAMYLLGALAARDLDLITPQAAAARIADTLAALGRLERHAASGQFYNWYDPATGDLLTEWPDSNGAVVCPFLSSVDNAWLAAALMAVADAVPAQAVAARALLDPMDFAFFYDSAVGLFWGGYWPPEKTPPDSACSQDYTAHHYGVLNSETRIIGYVAMGRAQVPTEHYYKLTRTYPDTCAWDWQEMRPTGAWASYSAENTAGQPTTVAVFEGSYEYYGLRVVPGWGGGMFEALMPNLLVPETDWGPASWALNHPAYVHAQMFHGLSEAAYGYWGFSSALAPSGAYDEFGVDALGLYADGYPSDAAGTTVDYGFAGCAGRAPQPRPTPDEYVSGVVTPHAAFLALEFVPQAMLANLAALRADFAIYDADYGFYDAVRVDTGAVTDSFLALDQGMIFMALANYLTDGAFRHYFSDQIAPVVRPLLAQEQFANGPLPAGCAPLGAGGAIVCTSG